MAAYVARVEPDETVRVYADDWERPVATIPLPPGANLRRVLLDAGWRPTGRRARGGWGSIFVTPAEDDPRPSTRETRAPPR